MTLSTMMMAVSFQTHTDFSVHKSLKRVCEWFDAEEAAPMTQEMATLHSSVIECH
jgi:hypothetical protein